MVDEAYVKAVERDNEKLQQMLADAQSKLDAIDRNPLEASLTGLIACSLNQQKRLREKRTIIRCDESTEICISLPRQVGISTAIVAASAKFFDRIDIVHNGPYRQAAQVGNATVYYHRSVNDFIGQRVSCVIFDPWRYMYSPSGAHGGQEWNEVKDKIRSRFDGDKPCLLIMAG